MEVSPESIQRQRLRRTAYSRALCQLREKYPEDFEEFYDEELSKLDITRTEINRKDRSR